VGNQRKEKREGDGIEKARGEKGLE